MLSAFLKKLIFARQFCIVDGRIEILGIKQVMLPMDLLIELQSINPKKTYQATKTKLWEIMERYYKKVGGNNQGILNMSKEIFETIGLGKMEVINFKPSDKKAIIRIKDSAICNCCQQNKNCSILPGALAGTFSFIFKNEVNSYQKEKGKKSYCDFIIK